MNHSKINVYKLGAMLALALVMLVFGGQAFGEDDDDDGGTIIFVKPVKAVVFEHKNHIDQGLECDSCHDDLFEMEAGAAEANDNFTMAALYEGKYCGACHDGDMAFASNTRCTVCHIGVKGYNRAMGNGSAGSGGH
jgi:c(7)-type cytochrome triheme protein